MGFYPALGKCTDSIPETIQKVGPLIGLRTVAFDYTQVSIHLHPFKVEDKARTAWVDSNVSVVEHVVAILPAFLVRWVMR
jgi:hypothetical protein